LLSVQVVKNAEKIYTNKTMFLVGIYACLATTNLSYLGLDSVSQDVSVAHTAKNINPWIISLSIILEAILMLIVNLVIK